LGIREFQEAGSGAFRPDASEVVTLTRRTNPSLLTRSIQMVFESVLRGIEQPFDYLLEMKSHVGETA
jgi:hypothetical protein